MREENPDTNIDSDNEENDEDEADDGEVTVPPESSSPGTVLIG